jgi:predicted transcriptional regulator
VLTRLQVDILEAVAGRPGMTQRALARQLGESRQVVSYNVGVLKEAGLLRGAREGRGAPVDPTEDTVRAVEEARTARTVPERGEPDAA